MNYRTCAECGCPMDPGEGRNGVCEDCIQKEADREAKKRAMELLGDPEVGFRQIEWGDFL